MLYLKVGKRYRLYRFMNAAILSINGKTSAIGNKDDLRDKLQNISKTPFCEVWITLSDGKSISALINREISWLMYLRYDGDPGFSSRNAEIAEDKNEMVTFYLSNGQRDQYPLSYTVSTASAVSALEYFFAAGDMAPWIKWHDDSIVED